jgi:protocadherin Fat 4
VRYFLKEGDTDLFRINASTGDISLLRPLDRELVAEYTLTLVAMDTGKLNSSPRDIGRDGSN